MNEKEKSWDLNFLANGDEEKYCIHKAGGTTPVKYRLEADILTLMADNNNNNNNKIGILWDWHLKLFQPLTLCSILATFCFKNSSRSNFWWNCLPAMFGGRGRDTGEHQRPPYHRDQWAFIQSQIWGGWYQSIVTFVTSVEGVSINANVLGFVGA